MNYKDEPNYQAFERDRKAGKLNAYDGQHVAYAQGEFAGSSHNRFELSRGVREKHRGEVVYIAPVVLSFKTKKAIENSSPLFRLGFAF